MAELPMVNSSEDQNKALLDCQTPNQEQNQTLQNQVTPYNSTNFVNNSMNQISQTNQQSNYTPQDLNFPINHPFNTPFQDTNCPSQEDYVFQNNTPQTEMNKYKNISEIPHKHIYQTDSNTFYIKISTDCCLVIFPLLFIFIGIGVFVFYFFLLFSGNESSIIILVVGVGFIICGIYLSCTLYYSIFFIMEPNSLKIGKKSVCGKKIKIYNIGELERVDFTYKYSLEKNYEEFDAYVHRYILMIIETKGKTDTILNRGWLNEFYTKEEIDYFLYHINNHIQNNMKMAL